MRCPATGRPAGVGSNSTTTSATIAASNPQFDENQLDSFAAGLAAGIDD
jgi:hypothetical protein